MTQSCEVLDKADEEDEVDDVEQDFEVTRLSKYTQFLHVLIKVCVVDVVISSRWF